MNNSKLFKYTLYLSIIGIFLAIYLLFEQLTNSPLKPCNINATINCNTIISGAVSKTLGIPTPLYGLFGYIFIFLSGIYKKKKTLLGIATFGLLFCLWIAYQELFLLHVICPICIACQIIMLCIFIIGIVINKNPDKTTR